MSQVEYKHLIITREPGASFVLDIAEATRVRIVVHEVRGAGCRIGIVAPACVAVTRDDAVQRRPRQ